MSVLIVQYAPVGAPHTVGTVGCVGRTIGIGDVLRLAQVHVTQAIAAHAHIVSIFNDIACDITQVLECDAVCGCPYRKAAVCSYAPRGMEGVEQVVVLHILHIAAVVGVDEPRSVGVVGRDTFTGGQRGLVHGHSVEGQAAGPVGIVAVSSSYLSHWSAAIVVSVIKIYGVILDHYARLAYAPLAGRTRVFDYGLRVAAPAAAVPPRPRAAGRGAARYEAVILQTLKASVGRGVGGGGISHIVIAVEEGRPGVAHAPPVQAAGSAASHHSLLRRPTLPAVGRAAPSELVGPPAVARRGEPRVDGAAVVHYDRRAVTVLVVAGRGVYRPALSGHWHTQCESYLESTGLLYANNQRVTI